MSTGAAAIEICVDGGFLLDKSGKTVATCKGIPVALEGVRQVKPLFHTTTVSLLDGQISGRAYTNAHNVSSQYLLPNPPLDLV